MIFVDSNIPMYVVGSEHPLKTEARTWIERLTVDEEILVTSAEVYQEILHRYVGLDRKDVIPIAYDLLDCIVEQVFPITHTDVKLAQQLALEQSWPVTARDALHVAVMKNNQASRILTFDRDFDRFSDIVRINATSQG